MKTLLFKYRKFLVFTVILCMYIINISTYFFFWHKFYDINTFGEKGEFVIYTIYLFLYFVLTGVYKGNKVGILRLGEIIYSNILSILIVNTITYLQLCSLYVSLVDIEPILITTLIQIINIVILTFIANKLYFYFRSAREILAISNNINIDYEILLKMQQMKEKFTIKKVILEDVGIEEISEKLKNFNSVLLCNVSPKTKKFVIETCFEQNKRVYIIPSVYDIMLWSSYQTQVFDTPMLMCKSRTPTNEQLIIKRCIDIVFSLLGLIILSPFMIITAIIIKVYDGGPIFFKQKRCTLNEHTFNVLKFRSMVVDAEKDGPQKATQNDNRITPIGKIIRMTRIDETPQLLNILVGDMSIVGPRPERIENIEEYCKTHPQFKLRLKVKAGLTGYAQIYGKYNTLPLDKLHLDLLYIQNFSIIKDLNIMLATVKILFMPTSTEGFSKTTQQNNNNNTENKDNSENDTDKF